MATVKCLFNEAYGDAVLSQDMCHRYTTILNNSLKQQFTEQNNFATVI